MCCVTTLHITLKYINKLLCSTHVCQSDVANLPIRIAGSSIDSVSYISHHHNYIKYTDIRTQVNMKIYKYINVYIYVKYIMTHYTFLMWLLLARPNTTVNIFQFIPCKFTWVITSHTQNIDSITRSGWCSGNIFVNISLFNIFAW